MKKIFLIATTVLAFAASSFATPSKPFTSGISLSTTTEFARGSDAPDFDALLGYRINLTLAYNAMIGIIPNLYVHPALGVSLRLSSESENKNTGSGFNMSVSSNDDKTVSSLDVLLPVTARYYITNNFFAELGLEFDFNILESFNTGSQKEDDYYESMLEPSAVNLGIVGGIGATFNFGLEISLTYTHGLTDLYKEKKVVDFNIMGYSIAQKNANWSYSRLNFNIGYWFGYRN